MISGLDQQSGGCLQLAQGIGFFHSFAESFWKSTRMDLDLVHQDGDTWRTIAGRIRNEECRDLALSRELSTACETCFRDACNRVAKRRGFQTYTCHADRRFSVNTLGECGGRKLLILVGRVRVAPCDEEEPPGHGLPDGKTIAEYEATIHLIELLLPYLASRLRIESILENRTLSPLVRRACRHIDRHYRDKLSLGVVASACGISEDHLSHVFSEQTGHQLTRYIGAVRVGHAMFLLERTAMDVTEICFEVGFQSVSQFNRVFRAMKGMSPTQYRRKQQSGEETARR
jgi:AraC-like DNA-binding protein